MVLRFLMLVLFCLVALALPLGQKPILKVSVRTHDQGLVTSMLYDAYSEAYKLKEESNGNYITNFSSLALQYSADKYCVENSAFRYYIKSFRVEQKEYPASQCALNLSPKFSSIVMPEPEFHKFVHGTTDLLSFELETRAQRFILELESFDFKFEQFDDLDYDLECIAGYYELMQVIYNEKVLTVNLEVQVSVPPECTFSKLNSDFDTTFDKSSRTLTIPMRGEFYCQSGSSVSCKKSMANTRNFRYKLYE